MQTKQNFSYKCLLTFNDDGNVDGAHIAKVIIIVIIVIMERYRQPIKSANERAKCIEPIEIIKRNFQQKLKLELELGGLLNLTGTQKKV